MTFSMTSDVKAKAEYCMCVVYYLEYDLLGEDDGADELKLLEACEDLFHGLGFTLLLHGTDAHHHLLEGWGCLGVVLQHPTPPTPTSFWG